MAGYGRGGGFNTYKEVKKYEDDWGKPITMATDFPDHVHHPVIINAQGRKSSIVPYSVEHAVEGYVVRAQRMVEVRHSYDSSLKGPLNEYNVHDEWDDHSPRKAHDFIDKVHNEASRPTHTTLLNPPKWSTKPTWRSEDPDSPKYSEHHDWEKSNGSPLRDKFEGLRLQDNRGSSPYSYKKDGYAEPNFTHSLDSPKNGHFKDYGVNNKWDSPPRSTHKDWDSKRGYKTNSAPLSQATNDIGTATKILEEGTKHLASPAYAPQSHLPAPYSTQQRKESYPERTQGVQPLASPISTQPSHYPTSNPITDRKESHPEPTKGMKPLFAPVYTQQSQLPTTNPTHQRKESYPETVHEANPHFSPAYTQQSQLPISNATHQRKESYPETAHDAKPLSSPLYRQQSHLPTSNPTSQNTESYPNKTQGWKPLFSPASRQLPHHPTSHSTPEIKESYPETAHDSKPLSSPVYTQQSHLPTSNPTSQNRESHPNKTQGLKPLFSPASKQQPHHPSSHSTPEMKESYPDHERQGWNPSLNPSSPRKEHYTPPISTPQEHYSDYIQGGKSFSSPYEYTQEPPYGASVPPKETIDSTEAKKRYADLKPKPPTKMKYSGTIDSIEAVKKYNGAFVP